MSTLDDISSELQNYVVSPLNAFGLGGFLFDAEGESVTRLNADITDHYAEDNKPFQDHIAIHPTRITLKGYVGEVIYTQPGQDQSFLQTAVQKLTQINAFLPELSAGAQQIQAAYQNSNIFGDPSVNLNSITLPDAANIYGLVKNIIGSFGEEARQQNAYQYFKALMNQGVLMGVQTPWEFLTNMAIESIVAIQGEQSKYITDFTITLKQIRIAKTISQAYSTNSSGISTPGNLSTQGNQTAPGVTSSGTSDPSAETQLSGAAALQAPNPVQIGNVPGAALPSPTLPSWQSTLGSVEDIIKNTSSNSLFGVIPASALNALPLR